MESIAKARPEDKVFPAVVAFSNDVFMPLLQTNEAKIRVPKKTFKFGPLDRNNLDIYYPPSISGDEKIPLLFFVYGGGLARGERTNPEWPLIYDNVGAFFASRGFLTIIPDYRLVPPATYPQPAQDILDAMNWVTAHVVDVQTGSGHVIDTDTIFFIGHSAGCTHITTVFLEEDLRRHIEKSTRIKGLVLVGGAFHFRGGAIPPSIAELYYGSMEQTSVKEPIALLTSTNEAALEMLPDFLLVESEDDTETVKQVGNDFYRTLLERLHKPVEKWIARGHNHISVFAALSSGEGEEWAEMVVDWLNERK